MAGIAPGLSGTFKQRSLEGRLLETLIFVALAEQNETTNPENLRTVKGAIDSSQKVFKGTYAIPAMESANEAGELTIKAKNHLQGLTIDPGLDNPTFRSQRPEAYALEVLKRVQAWERNPAKNPKLKKCVTGTFDSDNELYTGTFELPIQLGLATDGSIATFAVEYLES